MAYSETFLRARHNSRTINKVYLLLPVLIAPFTAYSESFTAKRAGQGFTGITQDFTSSLSNPALLTKFDDDDDVFFSLNVGLMASDEFGVVETTEDISDALDELQEDINAIPAQNFQSINQVKVYNDDLFDQADEIIVDFLEIDEKIVKARAGGNFQILIPNNYLSLGLFYNQYGRGGAVMDYEENDEQVLYDAIDSGDLDLNDLDSAVYGLGYSVTELGIMAAYPVVKNTNYDLSLGTKIKYQRIDLYYNDISMNDLDDDDFEPRDEEYFTDESNTNLDLGLYASFGDTRQWHLALVTNNLVAQSVTRVEQNITFNLDSSAVLGLSYQNNWLNLAAEIDLTDREYLSTNNDFTELEPSKYIGLGAEVNYDDHIQFRVGYRSDLNDIELDIFTAGIGISPWDVFAIDLAAFTGDKDTYGGALQISLKI